MNSHRQITFVACKVWLPTEAAKHTREGVRVKRAKQKISGQISFDGTGSSHPLAPAKSQPALNLDFLVSKILNTFIIIVQRENL